jgi:hypothetical protein
MFKKDLMNNGYLHLKYWLFADLDISSFVTDPSGDLHEMIVPQRILKNNKYLY